MRSEAGRPAERDAIIPTQQVSAAALLGHRRDPVAESYTTHSEGRSRAADGRFLRQGMIDHQQPIGGRDAG